MHTPEPISGSHRERHCRVSELAKLWSLGRETVRNLVKEDPGVLKLHRGPKGKHTTYAVPESAAITALGDSQLSGYLKDFHILQLEFSSTSGSTRSSGTKAGEMTCTTTPTRTNSSVPPRPSRRSRRRRLRVANSPMAKYKQKPKPYDQPGITRIERFRRYYAMTLRGLEEQSGVPRASLGRIIHGHLPNVEVAIRLARVFQVKAEDIWGGK